MGPERPSRSLARHFAVAAASLTGLSIVVLSLASWVGTQRLHRESARQLLDSDAKWHATRVADTIVRIHRRLEEVATSPLLQTALTDSAARVGYLHPHLASMRSLDGIPVRLAIVDFEGRPISAPSHFDPNPQERAWFAADLAYRGTRLTLAERDGKAQLWFALGIVYPRTNTVEGSLWASLDVDQLPQDALHRLRAGRAATEARDAVRAAVVLPGSLPALPLIVVHEGEPPASLGDTGLLPVVVVVAMLLMLGAALAAHRVSLRLTRDLASLERFARAAGEQSFGEQRASESGPREVASLAGSINRMLDDLTRQHTLLQGESQQRLNLLATCIAHLNDVVLITDVPTASRPYHSIVFANPAFERMTGYTVAEVLGRSPGLLQGPDTDRAEVQRVNRALHANQGVQAELLNYTKEGRRYWVEIEVMPVRDRDGRVVNFVAIERDTSARRALDEQLRDAQKLEAIGTLAGGIAHDFNNVLAAILGNVALAQQDLDDGLAATDRLRQIRLSAERARALVQQILAYSRKRPQDRSPQELGKLVTETVTMLRATVPAGVAIQTRLTEWPVTVIGDNTSLQQVLLNLGTNAWQAMNGRGGELTFGLEVEEPPEGLRYAHLWVKDNGSGMDEATRRRIFEPFFTTKPEGKGTGLGLAVVEGIVRAHGGRIDVESEPGRGSTFHVRLPIASGVDIDSALAPEAEPERPLDANVLYVDDDEVLLLVVASLLERWGCRVTSLRSAPDAVAAVRAAPDAFDVVVSDYNMPGMSGAEVAAALAEIRADLPVVLTSGYVSDDMLASVRQAGARAVIQKERLHDELRSVLHQILAEEGRPRTFRVTLS